MNFMTSSLGWLMLGALTSRTHISRQANDAPTFSTPENYVAYGTTALPSYGFPSSSKVRSSDGATSDNSFLAKKDSLDAAPKNVIYVPRNPDTEMYNDVNQEELERERLYEAQVQEYRRRKKLEQMRAQGQLASASENVQVTSDKGEDATPFRSHPTLTPEEMDQQNANQKELDKRLMKIESYKKYLEQQQHQSGYDLYRNADKELDTQSLNERKSRPDILVKRKGPFVTTKGGNLIRKVRKIIKKPSSSN